MEIVEDRDDYCEEEDEEKAQMMGAEGAPQIFPFYPSSSSSSPSSSQSQPNGGWGDKSHRLWLAPAAPKTLNFTQLDAMDTGGGEEVAAAAAAEVEREHMFDKVVTPSDVGKLNRLVIPKQHAEKYFPLDSAANEKGLLLCFEDRTGKPWRFRYSYWNSSQSYVMTKGWSRFVKEKKLDAGDIVSFERGVGELGRDRLFIDWKRRPNAAGLDSSTIRGGIPLPHYQPMSLHRSVPWGRLFFPPAASLPLPPPPHVYNVPPVFYLRSANGVAGLQPHSGEASRGGVFESVPVVHGKVSSAGKRLRLFGVNLECPSGEDTDSTSMASLLPQPPSSSPLHGGGPLPTSHHDVPRKPRQPLSFDFDI